ncbi:MAG: TonB-dependent receptor [Siphonobacter sp.]
MKKLYALVLVLLTTTSLVFAQRITGKVTDSAGKSIIGATVQLVGTNIGTTVSTDGTYQLNTKAGAYQITVRAVGYDTQTKSITVSAGGQEVNFTLVEGAISLSDIVVVGSRSAQARTNIDSPVPVDVISTKELKGFAQVDVGQILNYVAPSFNSNRQTIADGTDHIDPASLRGLGPDQVLVLINGKRRHTSSLVNINGSVGRGAVGTDMNAIPVAAIERIEVLRDGAAAQYGSDAIAGVINIVMKNNTSGLTVSATGGENITNMKYNVTNLDGSSTKQNQKITDGGVFQLDLNKGFALGKKGGFLSFSGQYNEHGRTNRSGYDNAPTIYLGSAGAFPSTPGDQDATAFRQQLLTQDAQLVKQNGFDRHDMVLGNSSARNLGAFINGGLPLGKGALYFTGGLTYRRGKSFGNYRLPNSRSQQPLKADGSLYYPNGFLPAIESTINDRSLIAGYRMNVNGWRIDLSNTYGQNSFKYGVSNSGNAALANSDNPQTSFNAGKNIFTQNTINLDFSKPVQTSGILTGLNAAFGGEFRFEDYQIVAGEPNSYIGADLKKLVPLAPYTIGGTSPGTTLALPGSQVFLGFKDTDAIHKSRTSQSLYADFEGNIAKRLHLDVAGRFEHYSDFGSKLTGKIAGSLKLAEGLNLRGAASTGFRAPSLHQRYFQNTSTQFVNGNPSNTLTVNNDNPIARETIGVAALKPETSVNFSAGITARIARTLTLTADAFQIDIKNRIVYSGQYAASLLGIDASTGVNNVTFFANAANTQTRGLEVVLNDRIDVGKGKLTLTASGAFIKNKVTAINSTPVIDDPAKNENSGNSPDSWFKNILFNRQQRAYIESFSPRTKINLSGTYSIGKFDITLRTVQFGKTQYVVSNDTDAKKADGTYWNTQFLRDANGHAYVDQTFAAIWVWDVVLGYKITNNIGLTVGANNVFDKYPQQMFMDYRNSTGSIDYSSGRDATSRGRFLYQPNQGGYNGRYVYARLTFNFK